MFAQRANQSIPDGTTRWSTSSKFLFVCSPDRFSPPPLFISLYYLLSAHDVYNLPIAHPDFVRFRIDSYVPHLFLHLLDPSYKSMYSS